MSSEHPLCQAAYTAYESGDITWCTSGGATFWCDVLKENALGHGDGDGDKDAKVFGVLVSGPYPCPPNFLVRIADTAGPCIERVYRLQQFRECV